MTEPQHHRLQDIEQGEGSSLLRNEHGRGHHHVRHLSVEEVKGALLRNALAQKVTLGAKSCSPGRRSIVALLGAITLVAALFVACYCTTCIERTARHHPGHDMGVVIPIERAHEATLDIGDDLSMWYRTWGNRENGVPVLFVHGGPGISILTDYGNSNGELFPADEYFVVEADQRGTGLSQPSVWDDQRNMEYYDDITVGAMSHDFETLRAELSIEKWLVFGGSWGSTLGLDYSLRYPHRCLGVILRGIFLNTQSELDEIYQRRSFEGNIEQKREFDAFFKLAAKEASDRGEDRLDPNDSERFVRLYERMIRRGDRDAIWRWYVFENNIMADNPAQLRDFNVVVEDEFPEARSVAFFESKLILRHTIDEPMNLLRRVHSLKKDLKEQGFHYWICHGRQDKICPEKYAHQLVDALESAEIPIHANFVDAGHQGTDPIISECLKEHIDDFSRLGLPQ